MSSVELIVSFTLETSKNWFIVFDVYVTIPVFPEEYVTNNSPDSGKPIVESTSKIEVPAETLLMIFVFGCSEKSPKRLPLKVMSFE